MANNSFFKLLVLVFIIECLNISSAAKLFYDIKMPLALNLFIVFDDVRMTRFFHGFDLALHILQATFDLTQISDANLFDSALKLIFNPDALIYLTIGSSS